MINSQRRDDIFPICPHCQSELHDVHYQEVSGAAFVYQTAMRDEMLPRKPLPDPMKYPVRR